MRVQPSLSHVRQTSHHTALYVGVEMDQRSLRAGLGNLGLGSNSRSEQKSASHMILSAGPSVIPVIH